MLVGQPPFVGATQLDTYHKVTRGKYKSEQQPRDQRLQPAGSAQRAAPLLIECVSRVDTVPTNFARPVKDLISRLLMHNPAARLGCSWGGSAEVLGHDFFASLSFKDLEKRKVTMPFVPVIKDPFDSSNFDQYSDDDQAGQWTKFNTPKYEEVWKAEFEIPEK